MTIIGGIVFGIICGTFGLLAGALCNVSGRESEREEHEETLRGVVDTYTQVCCENERLRSLLAARTLPSNWEG